jgi:hypothetical protein
MSECKPKPPGPWMAIRPDLIRAALLAIGAALFWCAIFHRWTVETWQTPIEYLSDPSESDVPQILAWFKAAADGHFSPFEFVNVPELGAPYIANWNDYPVTEKPLICLAGLLANLMGLFPAANFSVMLGQVLAAVSFYAACRLMQASWIWSAAGGLIFAFSRYAFSHGLHHVSILYFWHLPLCLVVCAWIFQGAGIMFGERRFMFALVVAVVTGVQNVYYTNLFVQLVLFGALLQASRQGWKASLPAISIVGATAAACLLMNANTILYAILHGANSGAVVRNYQFMEYYGLKLVDLVMPPPSHRLALFAAWETGYAPQTILSKGENPTSAYLGIIGLSATAWLIIHSWRRVVTGTPLPLEAWMILWIIVYAGVGGINGILGTLGFQLFRTATRYSIVILCMALMFAVRRLSLVQFPAPALMYSSAALCTCLALWDQVPPLVSEADLGATARAVASDRNFVETMEERLPANAMVFQFPVIDFPESPTTCPGAYDHFRPYLFSHHLHISFGSDKGRARELWQYNMINVPLAKGLARLESFGFSALYVDLRIFPDKGKAFIAELRNEGRSDMFQSGDGTLLCVLLNPSRQPVLPDGS